MNIPTASVWGITACSTKYLRLGLSWKLYEYAIAKMSTEDKKMQNEQVLTDGVPPQTYLFDIRIGKETE